MEMERLEAMLMRLGEVREREGKLSRLVHLGICRYVFRCISGVGEFVAGLMMETLNI